MMVQLLSFFRKCFVRFQIYIWRQGWVVLLLLGLGACTLALQHFWKPHQQMQLTITEKSLIDTQKQYKQLLQTPLIANQVDPNLASLNQLNDRVYAQKDSGLVLQLIAQIAKTKNISLSQSEIQTIQEGYGGLQQLQVTLPVRTGYIEMRQFIQEILRLLNGVSVDQITIKRENVSQGQLEARIKLSLWIDVNKQTSRPVSKP
jgi:hypothetical protein